VSSCLYECSVYHKRFSPKRHEFLYRVFLFSLDVDSLPLLVRKFPLLGLNSPGLYSFWDEDHFRLVNGSARANVEAFLATHGIAERPAKIQLLTNLRFLGYTFNPNSIWYCFREDGSPLAAVAEVGNTFRELKPFLVPFDGTRFHLRTPKHFYVSPFSSLDLEFDFRFETPGNRLAVYIDDYRGGERVLLSTLTGNQHELTTSSLLAFTAKYPLITLRVIFLIHWQAFRIWLKKMPFYRKEDNPDLQQGVFQPKK
jgi:DUF1365 family protein